MADREQRGTGGAGNPQPQGDGDDAAARAGGSDQARPSDGEQGTEEVGRVGEPARGGEGGYGNDTGFAGGTTGSREGLSAGKGDSSQSPLGRSNDGGMR